MGKRGRDVRSRATTPARVAVYAFPGDYFGPAGGFVSYRRVTVSQQDFSVSQQRVSVFDLRVGGVLCPSRVILPVGTGVSRQPGGPGEGFNVGGALLLRERDRINRAVQGFLAAILSRLWQDFKGRRLRGRDRWVSQPRAVGSVALAGKW